MTVLYDEVLTFLANESNWEGVLENDNILYVQNLTRIFAESIIELFIENKNTATVRSK